MIYPSLCFVLVIIVLGNFMNFAFASDHAFNDNLVRQCLNSNLSSVRISQIELSPFILCENSPIFVRLKEVNLEGLDSIKLLKPPQLSLSDDSLFKYRFSPVKIDGFYEANSSVSQLFPVFGSGVIQMLFDNVEMRVSLGSLSDGKSKLIVEDIEVSDPKLTIEDNSVSKLGPSLSGDESIRKSLGKVVLWRIITQLRDRKDFELVSACLAKNLRSDVNIQRKVNRISRVKPLKASSYLNRRKREIMNNLKDKTFSIEAEQISEKYWFESAEKSINEAVNHKVSNKPAKNVILFLGDGMGVSTLTAARILKGQLNGKSDAPYLRFEEFPNSALIKTFNLDKHVPDSAGTASAFMTGVKANYQTLGVNGQINSQEKDCDKINKNAAETIMTWAQRADKATGVVTTMRITHATPAASYAHVAHRWWENDADIRNASAFGTCKDIARQLVEDEPGSKFKVIYGGGRKNMVSSEFTDSKTGQKGRRTDGKDLIGDWINLRKAKGSSFKYINSTGGLKGIDYEKTEYVLGLFSYDHLPYEVKRDKSEYGEPSLMEMTESAIRLVNKYDNGYVLLIEGGLIDWAHHRNRAAVSLLEVLEFEKAIQKALTMVSLEDTMIVVTADHSHTFTISGYAPRNQSIFGFSDEKEKVGDKEKPFTSLMYATGPGKTTEPRPDPSTQSVFDTDHQFYSAVNLVDSTHGGEDVALYSAGPNSHLFHGLQDQTVIAHIIAYSSCTGRFESSARCTARHSNVSVVTHPSLILIAGLVLLSVFFRNSCSD